MKPPTKVPALRRPDFLRIASAGSILLGTGGFRWPRGPLEMAEAAGAWLSASARETPHGLTWPVAPAVSDQEVFHIYSGTPGVILFLLELHHATGKDAYLRDAEAGGHNLLNAVAGGPGTPQLPDWGLYTGLAGVAYTLAEVHRVGRDPEIAEGAGTLIRRVMDDARPLGKGVAWYAGDPESASYDIIGGSAGIGLTLLYVHEQTGAPEGLAMATEAGRALIERGRKAEGGLKWPMSEAYPRLMPNFSHGTAGVAYFLARLFEVTGDERFLAPAESCARYLEAVSARDGEGG